MSNGHPTSDPVQYNLKVWLEVWIPEISHTLSQSASGGTFWASMTRFFREEFGLLKTIQSCQDSGSSSEQGTCVVCLTFWAFTYVLSYCSWNVSFNSCCSGFVIMFCQIVTAWSAQRSALCRGYANQFLNCFVERVFSLSSSIKYSVLIRYSSENSM